MAILALTAALGAWGDSFVRIVRISHLSGIVKVSRPDTGQTPLNRWGTALLNAPVVEGESIQTLANGQAEVQLECGSALRLAPNSEMAFSRLRLRGDGVRITEVKLDTGTGFFAMQKADSQAFQVEFRGSEIATLGSAASFRVDVPSVAAVRIQLFDGHARARASNTAAWLTLEKTATLELPLAGSPRLVANAAPDQWTRWSRGRDQQYQRAMMASQPQPAVSASESAPPTVIAAAPQVSSTNPGGSFANLDANVFADDPFFATAAQTRRVPYCHD